MVVRREVEEEEQACCGKQKIINDRLPKFQLYLNKRSLCGVGKAVAFGHCTVWDTDSCIYLDRVLCEAG